MALTAHVLSQAILRNSHAGAHPLDGLVMRQVATAVGMAFVAWGAGRIDNLALSGVASGLAGAGVIVPATTRVVVPPDAGLLAGALTSRGIAGPLATSLAAALAAGICDALYQAANYAWTSPLVATGSDASRITTANGAALSAQVALALRATVGHGPLTAPLAEGLGHGVAAMLLAGVGQGTVAGVPLVPAVTIQGRTDSMVL